MPRAGLSADVIVCEAARLVDEVGRDQLTMAKLAKRFGVAQPSLYKHINRLDGLHRLLAVKVTRDVGETLRQAATGKAGPDALRAIANAYRDYARSHPGRYAYILRAPAPEDADLQAAATEVLSVLYAIFAGYDITGDDAVDAARFVRSTLHGFVSLELGGGFQMPRSVDRSFERLVSATTQALSCW
ncbi:MAG: WHG domain-containing protein [Actinomycetota bacterium]|nr:WHG domain-containing protein [Actinomycetota bacterium]